jgi:hypothetical protein
MARAQRFRVSARTVIGAFMVLALSGAPLAACNAIWGIDEAILIEEGGSEGGAEASSFDGRPPDATHLESGRGDVATNDGRSKDTASDRASDTATDGSQPSVFDGHCPTGAAVVVLASNQDYPEYIASDEAGVYWTDFGSGSLDILRFGTAPVVGYLAEGGMDYPEGVAVSDGRVVWIAAGIGKIFDCSAAGCDDVRVLAASQPGIFVVAASAGTAFWPTKNAIQSCSLTGCDGGPTPVVASAQDYAGLAVDARYVYWSNGTDQIASCPLTGCTSLQTAIGGEQSPTWVTVDNGAMYWSSDEGIRTCTLVNGACEGAMATTFVGSISPPSRLAADDSSLYFVDPTSSTLHKVSLDGGAPDGVGVMPLYTTYTDVGGVAVGESCVFWTEEVDGGAILAGPK